MSCAPKSLVMAAGAVVVGTLAVAIMDTLAREEQGRPDTLLPQAKRRDDVERAR